MTRTCLVVVFGPQNVIPAIAAMVYYHGLAGKSSELEVRVLVHNPGLSDALMEECGEIVRRMTKPFGWSPPIVLKSDMIKGLLHSVFQKRSEQTRADFQKFLDLNNVDEIFFSHNLVGDVMDLCFKAFPDAEWITTGDGIGQFYGNEYLEFVSTLVNNTLKERILTYVNKARHVTRPAPISTDLDAHVQAIAILPTDWSGKFLTGKKLIVIPRNEVLKNIRVLAESLIELNQYCEELIKNTSAPRFIVILNNFSDGNFISFEKEVAMYVKIIRTHVPQGSALFIKPHPFSRIPYDEHIFEQIEHDYHVLIISPSFNKYPFELMEPLFTSCNVIAFSTVLLSITYFFEKNVINPMNETLMKKYFPTSSWPLIMDSQVLYSESIQKIPEWDGASPLLSGYGKQKAA